MFRSAKRPTSFVSLKAVVTVERANAISLFRLIGFAKIDPPTPPRKVVTPKSRKCLSCKAHILEAYPPGVENIRRVVVLGCYRVASFMERESLQPLMFSVDWGGKALCLLWILCHESLDRLKAALCIKIRG